MEFLKRFFGVSKKNSAPHLQELLAETIKTEAAKKHRQESEQLHKEREQLIDQAIEDSAKKFQEFVNNIEYKDAESAKSAFNEILKPSQEYINDIGFHKILKRCFSILSEEEKTKFCDLFLEENTEQRKIIFDAIKYNKSSGNFYPLNIDFLNNKNAQTSSKETVFEIIAKNKDSDPYNDKLENYYEGFEDPDLSSEAFQHWKNFDRIFSLSIDSEFSNYLLEKYAKTYDANDKNHESTKILDFAMENMGKAAKNEFLTKIENLKSQDISRF
jgi:hypothetical protein